MTFCGRPEATDYRDLAASRETEQWWRLEDHVLTSRGVPFGAAMHHATGAGRFYLGRSDRYEVAVHQAGSTPALLIRRADPPRPVTAQDRAAYRDARLGEVDSDPDRSAEEERILGEIPYSDTHPAFMGLEATTDGRLWVREPTSPVADTATWAIYGLSGLLEGRVRTPADLEIQQVGPDFVLALRRSEVGVERLELWGLRGPAPMNREADDP